MATVYSLICWGGLTGKSVTASNSSGLIFTTASAHGLRDGAQIQFTGAPLPGNVSAGTTYYAKSLSASTFSIYTDSGLTSRVAWASAGTSVVARSQKSIEYLATPPTAKRWGTTGYERCYDSFSSWNTARSAAVSTDVEVLEIGEAFTLIDVNDMNINIPAGALQITTKVNGVRSPGWHGGEIPDAVPTLSQGFILQNPGSTGSGITLASANTTIEGFIVKMSGGSGLYMLRLNAFRCAAENMIAVGPGYSTHTGIRVDAAGCTLKNSIAVGWNIGIRINVSQLGLVVANCIASKNTLGMYGDWADCSIYNCVSIGNTTDWGTFNTVSTTRASNNAGLSGQAWATGSNPRFTIATTDFVNWGSAAIANSDDYRPAASGSPQVENGVVFYGALAFDIASRERPDYMNGAAEFYDIGAYEFDHGYGPRPASHVLTLTNVVVGSRVHVASQDGAVVHYDDIAASSTIVITQTVYGDSRDNWRIRVRKASDYPAYQPYETLMTATAGSSSIYVSQIPDE